MWGRGSKTTFFSTRTVPYGIWGKNSHAMRIGIEAGEQSMSSFVIKYAKLNFSVLINNTQTSLAQVLKQKNTRKSKR